MTINHTRLEYRSGFPAPTCFNPYSTNNGFSKRAETTPRNERIFTQSLSRKAAARPLMNCSAASEVLLISVRLICAPICRWRFEKLRLSSLKYRSNQNDSIYDKGQLSRSAKYNWFVYNIWYLAELRGMTCFDWVRDCVTVSVSGRVDRRRVDAMCYTIHDIRNCG